MKNCGQASVSAGSKGAAALEAGNERTLGFAADCMEQPLEAGLGRQQKAGGRERKSVRGEGKWVG